MSDLPSLIIKAKAELPLQASKWLKCPVLLDVEEMQSLIAHLENFWIFQISGVIRPRQEIVSGDQFLQCYQGYIDSLKKGERPNEDLIRPYFSAVFTVTSSALYAVSLTDQQQLVKVKEPVVQLQHHKFDYSTIDGKFRSMILGPHSISWGIQFSYPQLYQDDAMQIKQVKEGAEFPNTALFHRLQRWVRQNTVATPFMVNQQKVNVPIRLGKKCFGWINQHLQLAEQGLRVVT